MSALRSLLITDSPTATVRDEDVVLWLGHGDIPWRLRGRGRVLLEPSSPRAAAVYAASCPTLLRLALADPLPFAALLVEVSRLPALRAA